MGEAPLYGECIPDRLANGGSSEGNDMSIGQPPIVRYKVPNDQDVEPQQHIRCQKGPRLGATGASLGEIRSRRPGRQVGDLREGQSCGRVGHCARNQVLGGQPGKGILSTSVHTHTAQTHTHSHIQRQIVSTGRQRGGSRFLAPRPSI